MVDELDGAQQFLQQRLAQHQHGGAAPLQLAGEAHEQEHVGQALLGIEQDAPAGQRTAIPGRLREVRRRRLGQPLARLVIREALGQFAAHQQRDRQFEARPAIVGIERQRPAEAAHRLVEAAEVAQAKRQVEEAFAVISVQRDRMEVMLHRLVEAIDGPKGIAEVGMQRRIAGLGRQRQAVMADRGFELARQPQRHAEIIVQFGVIGPHRQQLHVGADGLVEAAGAMGLGREPELLDEGVVVAEQWRRRRRRRSLRFGTERIKRRRVVHPSSLHERPTPSTCN